MKTTRLNTTIVIPQWKTTRRRWTNALDWFDRQTTALIVVAFLVAVVLGMLVAQRAATVATVPPVVIIATAQPVIYPTAVPQAQQVVYQPAPAVRYVTAWAAPNGAVLGPIPWSADRPILGRFGDEWLMTSWQDGQVWIRAADLGSIANLAPAVPQPQPQVIYQVVNAPPPAPEQPAEQQPAAAPLPAPQAQPAGPTPSLQESLARVRSSLEATGGGSSSSWKLEHCIGNPNDGTEVCTP